MLDILSSYSDVYVLMYINTSTLYIYKFKTLIATFPTLISLLKDAYHQQITLKVMTRENIETLKENLCGGVG